MNETSRSALADALEIQERAAAVGFDWPDAKGPRAKIAEELAELDLCIEGIFRHSGASRNPVGQTGCNAKIAEELGDLFFAIVNLARHLGVELDAALAAANAKFQRRFRHIERRLAADGLRPQDSGLARLDALWDEAKSREGGRDE